MGELYDMRTLNKAVKKLLKEDLCSAYKQPNIQKIFIIYDIYYFLHIQSSLYRYILYRT